MTIEKQYICVDKELNTLDVLEILRNVDTNKITTDLDFRPKGNSVYVLSTSKENPKNEDWKADGYTWKRIGTKKAKVNGEGLNFAKTYFKLLNQKVEDGRFKKNVFRLDGEHENQNLLLIQYIGDETVFVPQPHGNSKSTGIEYVRTKPSVYNKIKEHTAQNPVSVMNKINSEINAPCKETGFSNIRNKRQISNAQARLRQERGLGPDALYNLHELFYHLDGYISDIVTAPDLIVLIGLKEIHNEFDRLLQMKTDESVPLYYDTTFNLGDFYVSTLSFQHILFDSRPVIPLAIMIHERKFQKCHEMLFNSVKQKIPRLSSKCLPIVTDREIGIINAIKNVFPNLSLLLCWNHIIRDTKEWLRKNGENMQNISVYMSHIRKLLESTSETEYNKLLHGCNDDPGSEPGFRLIWTQLFVKYFDSHLDIIIKENAGKWVVEESDVYNPFAGITNNAAESNHARYKKLLEFKEKEVDVMVLFMQYLQNNDVNSLMKGFCNLGDLTLRKKFKHLKKDPDDVELKSILHPDKIIEKLRGQIQYENGIQNTQSEEPHTSHSNSNEIPEVINDETKESKPKPSSQAGLAINVIEDKGITLVPELGGFMVRGENEKLFAVKLFPTETCQCPSTGRCYHILAARLSINMPDNKKKQIRNLTSLRRKSRPRADKKSGRKKPRIGDLDNTIVNPASDSILLTTFTEEHSDENPDLRPNVQFTESTPKNTTKTPRTPKSILKGMQANSNDTESIKKNLRFDSHQTSHEDLNIPETDNKLLDLEMELSRSFGQDECTNKSVWVESLNLYSTEKEQLLNNKKLTSDHMEAINVLARRQFPNIQGFQLTEKVPKYVEKDRRWHAGTVMDPVNGLACQIHHTHADHWVISFIEDKNIYVFDSLGTDRPMRNILTPSLQIQLAVLYGKERSNLHVIMPETQRQNNSIDCGLFAIAHLVEFCFKGSICPTVIYDTSKMRKHLAACFDTESLLEFPKTDKFLNLRRKKEPKHFDIPLVCMCNLPECLDDIVQCGKCTSRFHKHCVVSPADISLVFESFTCENCVM
ncbi:MAG: Ulp1 family isopeptidase [Candidatus Thiodiazotropha taylori]|nr:Ulp1 family isopeptidase [Candidatus Thiodiazotropha taylori]